MAMNAEMQEVLEKNIIYLATASKDAVPNVVPIGGKKIIDEQRILIVDVLLNKTKRNLEENPRVAIIVEDLQRDPPVSYQLKGKATIHLDGDYFQQAVLLSENAWHRREKAGRTVRYKVRSAVVVEVEEIYSNMHGGKRLSNANG